MTGSLVILAGKDPLTGDAGHSSYVRAHALAAVAGGFDPLLICIGDGPRVARTEFGTVIRARSPFRPVRHMLMPVHAPVLARAAGAVARGLPDPIVLHGFAVWAHAGASVAARLRAQGREAVSLMSAYASHFDEARSQLLGVAREPLRARASYGLQAVWGSQVISRYERAALAGSAAVFANYDSVRSLIARDHGFEGVELMPYASEAAFADPPGARPVPPEIARLEPQQAPLLVSASSHNGRKGVRGLIEALARTRDAGAPLRACLLGAGRLLGAHRELIGRLGLERSVIATGWVPDQMPYMAAADIFCLPSLAEQSGSLALLEAMQLGAACVASRVDGIPEDVEDGRDAVLVAPGDAAELAGALTALARDPDRRERLSRGARARFESRFSAPAFTAAMTAAYADFGLTAKMPRR